MRKYFFILYACFYYAGTICLPMGDFSAMTTLPDMYRHCKEFEDKDMTAIDFISDHLINIDCIFDKHENGDEQKPHQPPANRLNFNNIVFYTFTEIKKISASDYNISHKYFDDYSNHYRFLLIYAVFHPPQNA